MAPTSCTGYVFAEHMMWWNPGHIQVGSSSTFGSWVGGQQQSTPRHPCMAMHRCLPPSPVLPPPPLPTHAVPTTTQDALGGLQPTDHYEDVETKRRLNNLIHVSGLIDYLTPVKARPATKAELRLVHTAEHVENIQVRRMLAYAWSRLLPHVTWQR